MALSQMQRLYIILWDDQTKSLKRSTGLLVHNKWKIKAKGFLSIFKYSKK